MDDQAIINAYTEKSIAGLKEEHLESLWEPGDHMYCGEFVSPTRPDKYFASDAEVDAYRQALARMDGTVDAPAFIPQPAAAEEPAPADRDPFVAAVSEAAEARGTTQYRSVQENDTEQRGYDKHDDDDDRRSYSKHDDDDDDDERKSYADHDDDDD